MSVRCREKNRFLMEYMRVDVVAPLFLMCVAASYYAVYVVVRPRGGYTKLLMCLGLVVSLFAFGIHSVTGKIAPLDAGFVLMTLWLLVQRILAVARPLHEYGE